MEYIGKGHSTGLVLRLLELPASTFYHKPGIGVPGRPLSSRTLRLDGGTDPDDVVVNHILALLGEDFVDYGYRKVTEWLRWRKGYVVNHKKVLRLMRENKLTLPSTASIGASSGRRLITVKVPQPAGPRQWMEVDLKYVRVHGMHRNALVISIIDVFSREWVAYRVAWNIRKEDFIRMVGEVLKDQPGGVQLTIRSDNGSQFIANDVIQYLEHMGVSHEFIHPATPEENAHIESFHSIMQRAMVRTREFESMESLKETLVRFRQFYNYERLHSATCFRPPMVFMELWKMGWIEEKFDKRKKRKFILSKERPLSPPFSERSGFSLQQC